MKRLIIICEGQTEREFCQTVLAPELLKHGVSTDAPLIKHSHGGVVPWTFIKDQIERHLKQDNAHVSMLIDYYGIKDAFGFPGWEEAKAIADKTDKMHFLFQKMSEDIAAPLRYRFIPYMQLHEFEGLLFSNVSVFNDNFPYVDITPLQDAVNSFGTPEMINNSAATAPSKRLIKVIPEYDKVLDGSFLAMEIGLSTIRSHCPIFDGWVKQLETI